MLDQMMMMMMTVLGWKISKSKVVCKRKIVYATKVGVIDIDLEESVAEVDVGLSVKQCVEWALGR